MKTVSACMFSVILLGSMCLTGCDITSSRNYLGTMAGAEIGGVIGEALGWMSTDRHDGPGKAMLGSIVGTVAGAAIGNYVTRDKDKANDSYVNGNGSYGAYSYGDSYSTGSGIGYQTGGGADLGGGTYSGGKSDLSISNVQYQDEDGDGRFSRNETVNIIFEVRNDSRRTLGDVELKVEAMNNTKCFVFSPASVVTIQAGETIRYKAKVFCKSKPSDNTTLFKVSANSKSGGMPFSELQIRMNK